MQIDLLPSEWRQFSREVAESHQEGECGREECALPICCASISFFRDAVLAISDNDSEVSDELNNQLNEAWLHLISTHGMDEPWVQHPTIQKFLQQTGLHW